MADKQHLIPVSLHYGDNFPLDEIVSLTHSEKELILCFKNGLIEFINLFESTDQSEATSYGTNINVTIVKANYFQDMLILLLNFGEKEENDLCIYKDSKLDLILENVDYFCTGYGTSNYIGVIDNLGKATLLNYNPDGTFSSTQINSSENYKAIAVLSTSAFVVGPKSKMIINLQDPDKTCSISIGCEKPFLYAFSNTRYCEVSEDSHTMVMLNEQLQTALQSLNFEGEVLDAMKEKAHFGMTLLKDRLIYYDFCENARGQKSLMQVPLENAKCVTYFKDNVYVATSNDVFLLVNMAEPYKAYCEKVMTVHDVLEKCNFTAPEYSLGFFEFLWNTAAGDTAKSKVISLIKQEPFRSFLYDCLKIYSDFSFNVNGIPVCENKLMFNIKSHGSDKNLLGLIYKKLKECIETWNLPKPSRGGDDLSSNKDKMNHVIKMFNAAIVECLALTHPTPIKELEEFLASNPLVDIDAILPFLHTIQDLELKMILLDHFGYSTDALDTFANEAKPGALVSTARKIILKQTSDWDTVTKYIEKFISADPVVAIEILTDPKVDIAKSANFINENHSDLAIAFSLKAIHHPNQIARRTIVNSVASELCSAMMKAAADGFEPSSLPFLKCVMRGVATVDDCKAELSEELHTLFTHFANELDTGDLLRHISQFPSGLQFDIYLAAERYEEALNITWKEGEPLTPEVQKATINFCRKCNDPRRAFDFFLKRLSAAEGVSIEQIVDVVSENVDVIDISTALGCLKADGDLVEISDLVESLFRSLVSSRREAQVVAAYAEAADFEARYRRARLESGHMTLTNDSVCSHCGKPLGFQYVQRNAKGELFHFGCVNQEH